ARLIEVLKPNGNVVYLIDASGSMLNVMGTVKKSLMSSVDSLNRDASFNVIAAVQDRVSSLDETMLPTGAEAKKRASGFLEGVIPHGENTAIRPAFERAVQLRPKRIIFFSDGVWEDK